MQQINRLINGVTVLGGDFLRSPTLPIGFQRHGSCLVRIGVHAHARIAHHMQRMFAQTLAAALLTRARIQHCCIGDDLLHDVYLNKSSYVVVHLSRCYLETVFAVLLPGCRYHRVLVESLPHFGQLSEIRLRRGENEEVTRRQTSNDPRGSASGQEIGVFVQAWLGRRFCRRFLKYLLLVSALKRVILLRF